MTISTRTFTLNLRSTFCGKVGWIGGCGLLLSLIALTGLCCSAAVADQIMRNAVFSEDNNDIIALHLHMKVPKYPAPVGTVFVWPGLQPRQPWGEIDNGVLQPVLTWGSSCAPTKQPQPYASWWVSAQYVNTFGKKNGFVGCQSGEAMAVSPGDELVISMTVRNTLWSEDVFDVRSGKSVGYEIDLQGQRQNVADFEIETWDGGFLPTALFYDIDISYRNGPVTCRPASDDRVYVETPHRGRDGHSCFIKSIAVSGPESDFPECKSLERLNSSDGGAPTSLSFHNSTSNIVSIYWVHSKGIRRKYKDLAANEAYQVNTFAGHSWVVTNNAGVCLQAVVASKYSRTIDVLPPTNILK